MGRSLKQDLELLAPAGSLEAFEAAVEAGADAVYIGAPALNARALAKHFSMAQIAAMIDHAHRRRVKVYLAMNSLMKEEEIPQAVRTLGLLEALAVDGVILQDLGLYHLAATHFPALRLHASTLLGAHNSIAVRQFVEMGFKRVVLARELTLEEIGQIRARNPEVELEVFIHGALCFSYSGLCLFSSYLGGKSGLRGRCVQPCRRRYTWAGPGRGPQSGYLFSMHDLAGLEFLPRLREAGITSIKIEGRMRSAHYVRQVVKAYRLVLDAPPEDRQAQREAMDLLAQAMGRPTTSGYFTAAQPPAAFSPRHSGNIGLLLGTILPGRGRRARVTLQHPVQVGDRLRLHREKTGERTAFTLKKMWRGDKQTEQAGEGESIALELSEAALPGDSLYKVDSRESRSRVGRESRLQLQPGKYDRMLKKLTSQFAVERILQKLEGGGGGQSRPAAVAKAKSRRPPGREQTPLPWWLRIDDLRALKQHLFPPPQQLLVSLNHQTYSQITKSTKLLKPHRRRLVWALPAIIQEGDLSFYREAVRQLRQDGYTHFQLGHLGQLQIFKEQSAHKKPTLAGDYTLNALNSLAVRTVKDLGLKQIQLAVESERDNLEGVLKKSRGIDRGLTVYGKPPLFTARPEPEHFRYQQPFVSPKGEKFVLQQEEGLTLALPLTPFSLLDFLPELAAAGLQYAVVDLSHLRLRKGELPALVRRITGTRGKKQRQSTFNYLGRLQ